MTSEYVMQQLQEIFESIFSKGSFTFGENLSGDFVEEWDSLNHAILIEKVEKHFEIKFDLMEVLEMENVGHIRDGILKKKN